MSNLHSEFEDALKRFHLQGSLTERFEQTVRTARRRRFVRRVTGAIIGLGASLAVFIVLTLAFSGGSHGPGRFAASGLEPVYVLEQSVFRTGDAVVSRIDPETGTYEQLATLDDAQLPPTITLSPQGDRLFVAWTKTGSRVDRLQTLDSHTGEVLQSQSFENLAQVQSPLPPNLLAASTSGDVYVYQGVVFGPDAVRNSILTYDVNTDSFRPKPAELGLCSSAPFLFADAGADLTVVCAETRTVHLISFAKSGAASSDDIVSLPPAVVTANPSDKIVGAAVSVDRSQLYVVTENAQVYQVDLRDRALIGSDRLGLRSNEYVPWGAFALSDDGSVAYVGSGPPGEGFDPFVVKSIHELTVGTWDEVHQAPAVGLTRTFAPIGNDSVFVLDAQNDEGTVVDVGSGTSQRAYKTRGVGKPLAIIDPSDP